ncbi:uncharacterized protein N7446_005585 [Penicillium canescens]|uniref:uncharacterized protein n=1 Tax=Penicillium canescens TaxID=5083 RepID=UPI0026E10E1B|nr:uncharacterized protein N7446_005585 [Penicillium canescens]KAJ6050176.1 hypothetical protein N7444_006892 [Penicillium canescens]KAJ6061465.1 hypothetical protein N7446_005585 [Penicillium canescens]
MAAWLDLVPETTGWSLVDTGRLERLVEELGHPETQYPSLIWFSGNRNRIKALQALFPHNNITRRGQTGLAQLHISTETAITENPVLFAETDLFNGHGEHKANISDRSLEKTQRYHIHQEGSRSAAHTRRQVITNVLFAFTHVLCLFVDTPSEMQEVLEMLQTPRQNVKIGSRSVPAFTRVIIVLTRSEMPEAHGTMVKELLHFPNASIQLQVSILDLRNRHMLSLKSAFEPLRRVVLDEVQISRTELIEQGLSFSSLQLCTLWNRTIELKMGSPENSALNCLKVARESHKMNFVTMEHLVRFLSHANDLGCATEDTHAFVASALFMNAYPPGMHCKYAFSVPWYR